MSSGSVTLPGLSCLRPLGFEEASFDERDHATLAARALGRYHHRLVVTPSSFLEGVRAIVRVQHDAALIRRAASSRLSRKGGGLVATKANTSFVRPSAAVPHWRAYGFEGVGSTDGKSPGPPWQTPSLPGCAVGRVVPLASILGGLSAPSPLATSTPARSISASST